jgi:homeodomain-containing protein
MEQRFNMNKTYSVRLTEQEREPLDAVIRQGKAAADQIKHANIFLKADADGAAWSDEALATAFSVHTRTVADMRARVVEHGLEAALTRKPQERPSHQPLFDGAAEAHRIALRCAEPPAGHARWPWRWLADTVVERDMVASASQETVRRTRKKPR